MSKQKSVLDITGGVQHLSLTRRGFIKGTIAVGATATLYGCSKGDSEDFIVTSGTDGVDEPDLTADELVYGTGTHNCGSRCLSVAHVKNGRIIRITSDETNYVDGFWQNPDSYNNQQARNCSKCRSYKYRLYHPGRLKYPLKQTKKRGDLSGFVRISWEQALNEIARKHKAIINAYGPESITTLYATANQNLLQRLWRYSSNSVAPCLIGGHNKSLFSYSTHQWGFLGDNHTGYGQFRAPNCTTDDVAGVVKNAIMFGSNGFTTRNHLANSNVRAFAKMRERGGKVTFIAPEFVDMGVAIADEWVQTKPFTDSALFNAMMYEMIVNTFNADGSLKPVSERWLDVDYIDTCVHGFFDSPEYWLEEATFNISFTDKTGTAGWRKINQVPNGRSLSAYIMGSDDRLTKAKYNDGGVYVAKQFATQGDRTRNMATCSYNATNGSSTTYLTKKDFNTPKTPEWAEAITGIPATKIRELAGIYAKEENHPVYTEWSGGQQKQADGVITLFSMQALLLVSKTFGRTGDVMNWVDSNAPIVDTAFAVDDLPAPTTIRTTNGRGVNNYTVPDYDVNSATFDKNPKTPSPSCIAWYNMVRLAFGDVMKANGYTGKYIPDQTEIGTGKIHTDDGGAKAFVKLARNADNTIKTYTDDKGDTYYDWEGRTGTSGTANAHEGTPIYSGCRFIFNEGGNILLNQHENPNDTREMFESIPITSPDDKDGFCVVSLDNFLSPTPRWSDYILPGATNWEQEQADRIVTGSYIFIPVVSNPPGEAKSCRDFSIAFLREYEKVDSTKAGSANIFIGADTAGGKVFDNDTYYAKHQRKFEEDKATMTASNRFYGKSFKEALKVQYQEFKPKADNPTTTVTSTPLRTAIDTYLSSSDKDTNPLILTMTISGNQVPVNTRGSTYGNGNEYPQSVAKNEPNETLKATVYSDRMVFQYEHRFEKWHGYLVPSGKQGQTNKDLEGDPIVHPIPMYYAYQDYFMEAYGGVDKLPADPLLLTTTHDHHRVHSTHSENPLLRELTHRTRGGKLYSGNDWKSYALSEPEGGTIPRLNKAIQQKNANATYSEIWMNASDGAKRGIADGDLIQVSNPIGAVRVVARLTERCTPGYLSLHQGCWYDPDPADGVDDGGCCNTLMASKPSRVDHGNGQQSAMVSVKRV